MRKTFFLYLNKVLKFLNMNKRNDKKSTKIITRNKSSSKKININPSKISRYNSKLNKLDKLIMKIDYLENNVMKLPKSINESIKVFINNNKYILIAISALIFASLGYKVYGYTKNIISPSGERVSKVLESISNLINTTDDKLNDNQKLIKYFYLYSIKEIPTSSSTEKIYNQQINKIIQKHLDDNIYESIKNSKFGNYLSSLDYLNSGVKSTGSAISSLKETAGTAITSLNELGGKLLTNVLPTSTAMSYVTHLQQRYDLSPELFEKCYYKNSTGEILPFNKIIEKIDLEKDLRNKIINCVDSVLPLLKKISGNKAAAEKCIGKSGHKNIIEFLIQNTDNQQSLDEFFNCYQIASGSDLPENKQPSTSWLDWAANKLSNQLSQDVPEDVFYDSPQ